MHDNQARYLASELANAESLFLRSQAGILAATLVEGAACPVCGSVHHPSPATVPEGVPTEDELAKIRKRKEKEDLARTAAAEQLAGIRAEYQATLDRLREASGTSGTASEAMDALDRTIASLQDRLRQARLELTTMESTALGVERLRKDEEDLRSRAEKLSADLRSLESISESAVLERAKAETELKAISEGLEYPDEASALKAIEKSTGRIEEAEARLKAAGDRVNAVATETAVQTSRLEAAKAKLEALVPRLDDLGRRMDSLLQSLGLDMDSYHRLMEMDADAVEREVSGFRAEEAFLKERSAQLTKELDGRERPDLAAAGEAVTMAIERRESASASLSEVEGVMRSNGAVIDFLEGRWSELESRRKEVEALQRMSDVANGRVAGAKKIQFEQYIQAVYFDRVLACANRRLADMSGGRFELMRKSGDGDNRSQTALDIDVLDNFTGKVRSVKSLSGGESFKAALSLALGLSDSIQMTAGGIRVDALFIDEGFGSLDSDSLQQALKVLEGLTDGNVMVGVISHVDLLRERIDKRISVTRERDGSRVEAIVD